jgi:serine phosphatase RsbU (regulator of sigma subunit)
MLFISIFIYVNLQKNRKAKNLISSQNESLEIQKLFIEQKQKQILESISYAKYLQEAILPPKSFLNQYIPENFIIYKPKDIVAGDFYWSEKVGDVFFVAVADSTGHGVPGALVSIVCCNALNRAVKEFKLSKTGEVLDKTSALVVETFEKSSNEVKDGMDISLLAIDFVNKKICWSGANNPLWYITDKELKVIKPNKQPIGRTDKVIPFVTHEIVYEANTTFYLFTDGFADQFGGENGKKFMYKKFSDLLLRNNHLAIQKQAEIVLSVFDDWKGNQEQVDDVCVIGLKI